MTSDQISTATDAGVSAKAKVAVVGLGAIGSVIAGSLAAIGRHDVTVCVRAPIDRLTVERPDDVVEAPVTALTDPAAARHVDWALLCTKVHQTATAADWLAALCGPQTKVAVLQNGIGHAVRLAPLVGQADVVPVIVYYNGERLAPDRARFRRAGSHDLAVRDDAGGQAFVDLCAGTPMRILQTADFDTLAWCKLLINAVANPVTALTLQRQAVFRREDVKALCLDILEETVAVARADGAKLAPDEAQQIMTTLLTYPPDAGTSMYFDRLGGRPVEVEAISGAIVATGARHGIPTPLNRMLTTLLRSISDAATAGQAVRPPS